MCPFALGIPPCERPHQRVDQQQQRAAPDEHLEIDESAQPEFSQQLHRAAHVHEIGLNVSLDPAGTLPDPRPRPGDRFLPGGRIEHGHPQGRAAEAYAQVAVLGHIERIPAPDLAECLGPEVIGGSAEGHEGARPVQPGGQPGQELVVPDGVVDSEHAGEDRLVPVVEIQARLQAHDVQG